MKWLVWFAYYSETASVGIVEADNPNDAREKLWLRHGEGGHWPVGNIHAVPAVPGQFIEIHAGH